MQDWRKDYCLPELDYDYELLQVERRNDITIVTLNNPANLNTLSFKQIAELNDFLFKVRMDIDCRAIILTGAGRAFCAGMDLNDALIDPPEDMGRIQRDNDIMQTLVSDITIAMHRCNQIIIGALKGYAVGGGMSMACACDLRILGESFQMGCGFLGIGYGGGDMGSVFNLPKLIGYGHAAQMLYNPRRVDSKTLYDWGFGNDLVPDDEVLDTAIALARDILDHTSPLGLRITKEAVIASKDGTGMNTMIKLENRGQNMCASTQDGRTGLAKMNPKNRADVKAHPEKYQFKNL